MRVKAFAASPRGRWLTVKVLAGEDARDHSCLAVITNYKYSTVGDARLLQWRAGEGCVCVLVCKHIYVYIRVYMCIFCVYVYTCACVCLRLCEGK